jgi:anaerobic magnesium-protoporphyrin IX monomethyl ester cyclase
MSEASLTSNKYRPNLLVDGVFHEKRVVPSLGVSAVGGFLRSQGIEADLFAPNITYMSESEAANEILRRAPAFLGISLLTSHAYKNVKTLLGYLRQSEFHPFLCMGGHFATLAYERVLTELPEVDCVILGDGEEPCADLLRCLAAGDDSWRQLPGFASRRHDGGIQFNGTRPAPGLDSRPMMALDFLDQLVNLYGREVRVSLVSSRGCYADCSYCSVRSYARLTGLKPYRMRSIQLLVDEIDLIQKQYGVRNFAFEDDNFLVPGPAGIKRAQEFRDAIVARGLSIRLFLQTRPECISHEAIGLLREVGLCDIFIGTESFDQQTLDLYHRNNTVAQTEHAFEVFEAFGFSANVDAERRVRIGSMIFHPYVTLDRLLVQAQFFRRYQIPSKKLIKHLFPVEDVVLCRRLEAEGLLTADGRYRFVHPEVQDVHRELNIYFDRFMSIREQIRRIEKMARLQRIDVDLSSLRHARAAIEDNFIDVFEAVCRTGDQGVAAIRDTCEQFANQLERALDIEDLRGKVSALLDEFRCFAVHD